MASVDLFGGDAGRIRTQYKTSLGRDAGDNEVEGWLSGSYGGGGTDDWLRQISDSDEAKQRVRTLGPSPGENTTLNPGLWTSGPPTTTAPPGPVDPNPGQTPATGMPQDYQQIVDWYQQYLGRTPGRADFAAHAGNPYGLGGVYNAIRESEEARSYAGRPKPPTPPTTGNTSGIPPGGFQALFSTLSNGKPSTPASLAAMESELAKYGIKLQKDSAGNVRGRLYFPDGRAVDVVSQWGQPWTWIDRGMNHGDSGGGGGGGPRPGGVGGGPLPGNQYSDPYSQLFEQLVKARVGTLQGGYDDFYRKQYESGLQKRQQALGQAEEPYQKLIAYLNERMTDLKGPGYTGAENEVIRTGALDPIENDRSAAKKRMAEQLSGRNINPESGVYIDAMLQVDKAFDGMRATNQTQLTTNDLNRREDRAQRAEGIGAQLVDIPQARAREQLDVMQALEILSGTARGEDEARSREAIGYAGSLNDLSVQRFEMALQAAGLGGNPSSLMSGLQGIAGLNQNAAMINRSSQSNLWSGLGSIAAVLANGRR